MNSALNYALTSARAGELGRVGGSSMPPLPRRQRSRKPQATAGSAHWPVTLRLASPDDSLELARLAELDSATPPPAPVLLAEVDGELRVALSLADGTVVADPFHPTLELVQLLRRRARQLHAPARSRPRRILARLADQLPAWRQA